MQLNIYRHLRGKTWKYWRSLAKLLSISKWDSILRLLAFKELASYKGKTRDQLYIAEIIYEQNLHCVLKCAKNWKENNIKLIGNSQKRSNRQEKASTLLWRTAKNGDKVKLVRDILYINGKPYIPEDEDEASGSTTPDRNFRVYQKKRRRVSSTQIHDKDSKGGGGGVTTVPRGKQKN